MRAASQLVVCACALWGCGSLYTKTRPPSGLTCDHVQVATSSLGDALAASGAGDCVIVPGGTYTGSFVLPENVSLAASEGASVLLRGDGSNNPVLTVSGGPRSTVRGVRIDGSSGGGIAISPGPANLVGVTIGGVSQSALAASCEQADCDQREVVVEDSTLTGSGTGLLVQGARVRFVRGRIAEMAGAALNAGSGVVATRGAQLSLEGVTVEDNQAVGVVVDGAGTRAALLDCVVRGNQGRGVWIQNVTGGAVDVSGGEISGNALVGLGVRDSDGVTVSGVTVQDTTAVRLPRDLGHYEDVGDGIALFTGAKNVTVASVVSRNNARAQLLTDEAGAGVRVTDSELAGGLFRAVVQRAAAQVAVPGALVDDPGRVLAVDNSAVLVGQ